MNTQRLGTDLSKLLKWDGLKILEVAHAALEDANFHSEALKIREMIANVKAEFRLGRKPRYGYQKPISSCATN
jgi:hypothetical protein